MKVLVVFAVVATLLFARAARADVPRECAVAHREDATAPLPARVRIGTRLQRLRRVDEKEGTFQVDIYLFTHWPAGSIAPKLVVRNSVDELLVVEDETNLVAGVCYRVERVNDVLTTTFRLHRFPLDEQRLRIVLEDQSYDASLYTYDDAPWPVAFAGGAQREAPEWRFVRLPEIRQHDSGRRLSPASSPAHLVTIELRVARAWTFYLTQYFLPLLVIVAIGWSAFFVDPEDLASSSTLGIGALLSIIAFQIAQSDALPRVAYLTLADRIYACGYSFTATTLAVSIAAAAIARKDAARARRLVARGRRIFPIAFAVALVAAGVTGWRAGEEDNVVHTLPPAPVPSGERAVE